MSETESPGTAIAIAEPFDAERHYVLAERDRRSIIDSVVHGAVDTDWVYKLPAKGSPEGISVTGARQLAALYKGLRHRIVFSIEKRGPIWIVVNYPDGTRQGQVHVQFQPDTMEIPDFYKCCVEVTDIKTGNSLQDEKTELRIELDRDGKPYENRHFATIAQAKAMRNAIEHIVPQDIVRQFIDNALGLKDEAGGRPESRAFAMSALDEARNKVQAFAVSQGVAIDRTKLDTLGMVDVTGLRTAAGAGMDQFRMSLGSLGLLLAIQPAAAAAAPAAAKTDKAEKAADPAKTDAAADGGQGGGAADGGGDGKQVTAAEPKARRGRPRNAAPAADAGNGAADAGQGGEGGEGGQHAEELERHRDPADPGAAGETGNMDGPAPGPEDAGPADNADEDGFGEAE